MITHRVVFHHFHRVFIPRFPYNLYYRLVQNGAVIVAILYARYDPQKIKETLQKRSV